MVRQPERVGVVGLGTMGAGIAEVFARAGLDVVGLEPTEDALDRGRDHLHRSTDRALRRGRLDEQGRRALLDRVVLTTRTADLASCDVVVEAVPERLELKRAVLTGLDDVVSPDAVLATNTSSLSVTTLAVATARPERVVGMHFFNPAPVQRLVEVVGTVVSDPAAVTAVRDLAARLGKTPVVVGDRAGFVANALLFGYLNRAVTLLDRGRVGRDDLDAAMVLGAGLPMGPLALLDLVGLDTAVEICETLHARSRDPLHAPAPLLRELVTAGRLGRKTGRGFHAYGDPADTGPEPSPPRGRPRPVDRVAVVGAEAGPGLADALAAAGYDVRRTDPAGVQGADLVVVAPGEDPSAATGVLAVAARAAAPGAVLVCRTRTRRVADLAAASGRPGDVVGLHLPTPATAAPAQQLAEVVPAVATRPDAVATVLAVVERLGWRPVTCPDRAGRVVDALLLPHLNDAVQMLESGYATVDDVDAAMTLGCGYPAGPFAVLDAIGLDVALAGLRGIWAETREPGLAPAPLLEQLVTVGRLGRATGRGFREHG